MHTRSQIQGSGEWGDVATSTDYKGKSYYYCKLCISKKRCSTRLLDKITEHLSFCKQKLNTLIENKDYVVCKICNFHCQKLNYHLIEVHNLSIENYKDKYNSNIICSNSSIKYSKSNKLKEPWQQKAKRDGRDLSILYKENGKNLSKSLMANPKERKRRSELITKLNDTVMKEDHIRKIYSDTAKKTSARPDIKAQRSLRLKNWRDNNPEEFKEKCTDKMLKAKPKGPTWFSKPEKALFEYVKSLEGYNFKFNQCITSDVFTWPSKRKQVDMADKNKNIFIELDGPYHFKLMNNAEKFEDCKNRDKLYNKYIELNKFILIRVSYDQFLYRKINHFLPECLKEINRILEENKPGIYKIGKYYG